MPTASVPIPSDANSDQLRLVFTGGLADDGILLLSEYARSLEGWTQFFEVAGELLLRSDVDAHTVPSGRVLQIEIVSERRGSWEAVFYFTLGAAITGLIGNRTDALVVYSFRRLVAWYRKVFNAHVSTKRQTTNVDEIVAALEQIASDERVDLTPPAPSTPQLELIPTTEEVFEDSGNEYGLRTKLRTLADTIDQSIQMATQPLDQSCLRIEMVPDTGPPVVSITADDRSFIRAPLTLPPPSGDWEQAAIKFVRINKKTGRSLFYFADDPRGESNVHFGYIVDPAVHRPRNVYTEAFNDDRALFVYLRKARAEKGRIHHQWQISTSPPDGSPLFDTKLLARQHREGDTLVRRSAQRSKNRRNK